MITDPLAEGRTRNLHSVATWPVALRGPLCRKVFLDASDWHSLVQKYEYYTINRVHSTHVLKRIQRSKQSIES